MGDTDISWTDRTWNCVRGCSRTIAAGSKQSGCGDGTGGGCYAERMAGRFCGPGGAYEGLVRVTAKGPRWTGTVRLIPEHLADPLRWRKPRRIFVNSMSDLFHESLTNEQIAAVFGVMAAAPQHTFQVLTKRARRMREWFAWARARAFEDGESVLDYGLMLGGFAGIELGDGSSGDEAVQIDRVTELINDAWARTGSDGGTVIDCPWPLPNVWLGVSVENQAAADERIPELLATPAAVRFLSCEPLIGPVKLGEPWLRGRFIECPDEGRGDEVDPCNGCPAIPNDGMRGGDYCGAVRGPCIDWIIAGCESGPGSRPCSVEWLRSLRDQCADAGVPFFLKQASDGYWKHPAVGVSADARVTAGPGSKRKAGGVIELPYLDGVQWAQFPEVSR